LQDEGYGHCPEFGEAVSPLSSGPPLDCARSFSAWVSRSQAGRVFWGLARGEFCVGRMIGVIGGNGAGKSTLLRLIGGVGRPDEGSVKVQGRIDALLDLGVGFHPDLTGRENVYISGVIND
jgi:homopolymeric O-antigen transport system ATP-binding protein